MASLIDGVSAVAVLGDDPVATGAVALGIGRVQALRRRVFILDLLGEGSPLADAEDEGVAGVSDVIRYGVSLGHAARHLPDSPNLFLIPGGMESPLHPDVLVSSRWASLSEMVHRSGGLLLLAVPSRIPEIETLLGQLDGVLAVGETQAPAVGTRLLGEGKNAATMRTPAVPASAIGRAVRSSSRGPWVIAASVAALLGSLAVPAVRQRVAPVFGLNSTSSDPTALVSSSLEAPPDAVPERLASNAAWSVELLFTNSEVDANARVRALVDSIPATTFSSLAAATDSARWFRVVGGAFTDSASAESFLDLLRTRGSVAAGAGSVVQTPYAFVLDSAQDVSLAKIRVSAYHGRGIPAYALRDNVGVWRLYAGAFEKMDDAGPLKQRLDSLNIQSVLVVRTGSTS